MSKMNYRAMMNDRNMMADMVSGILKGIEKSNAKRLDQERKRKMSKTKWTNVNSNKNTTGNTSSDKTVPELKQKPLPIQVNIPEMVFQIPVPDEFLADKKIHGEEILITIPQNPDDHVNVMVPDAAIPVSSCKEVAEKTIVELYKKGTGKNIDKSKLELSEYCKLTNGWCSQCNDQIEEIPYICAKCKRGFCFEHKNSHDNCSETTSPASIITSSKDKSDTKPQPKTKSISRRREAWC